MSVAIPNVKVSRDIADQLEASDGLEPLLLRISQADLAAADARHRDELNAGSWFHADPDREDLGQTTGSAAVAASVATWRGRWIKAGAPITALSSQALAGWAFDHQPEEPGRFRIL